MDFFAEADRRITEIIASLDDLIDLAGAERANAGEGGKAAYRYIQDKLKNASDMASLAQERAREEGHSG